MGRKKIWANRKEYMDYYNRKRSESRERCIGAVVKRVATAEEYLDSHIAEYHRNGMIRYVKAVA